MSYEDDLKKLSKEELVELIMDILLRYEQNFKKYPFVYCPVCKRKLQMKGGKDE